MCYKLQLYNLGKLINLFLLFLLVDLNLVDQVLFVLKSFVKTICFV